MGGSFTQIGGQPRNRLAALDPSTGVPTSWDPNLRGQVYDLAVDDGTVFAAGIIFEVGGQPCGHVAAIDAQTGVPLEGWPELMGTYQFYANALAVDAGHVYVGGGFSSAGVWPQAGFVAIRRPGTAAAETLVGQPRLKLAASPNPFDGRSTVTFTLPRPAEVSLGVYDLSGRLVRELRHGQLAAGRHAYAWDGRDRRGVEVARGIYFAALTSGASRVTTKLVRLP